MADSGYFAHQTAVIDGGARIGQGTKIWHFTHVSSGAVIGAGCVVGQGCYIADVEIGDRVRIQNNVSVYRGVTIEEGAFLGPSCVFTNVVNPRGDVRRMDQLRPTRVGRGATVGANATVVCGVTLGPYSFVGAGAVVTRDVPAHGLVAGVPARLVGWMCACGERLPDPAAPAVCRACGRRYRPASGQWIQEETQ
ncbi:MAG TPA: acyltransferase [Kofleriaceae bacterium]|nr:acyltransferase [Kofleriaceae bacterium]